MLKKAKRDIWGNETRIPLWWPQEIPFVSPRALIDAEYVHNEHTLGVCLRAYAAYSVSVALLDDIECSWEQNLVLDLNSDEK